MTKANIVYIIPVRVPMYLSVFIVLYATFIEIPQKIKQLINIFAKVLWCGYE